MRKTRVEIDAEWAKVGKTLRFLHNVVFTNQPAVANRAIYAQFFLPIYSAFSAAKKAIFNLLMEGFSTKSPSPITKITNLKKLIMELS